MIQKNKFRNSVFNNSRGMSLIELILSLFILSILSFGFTSLEKFLGIKTQMAQMEVINQSQEEIETLLEEKCPFKGEILSGKKKPITKIHRGNIPFYVSSEDKSFSIKNHNLGEEVFIKSMFLEQKQGNDFLLHVIYIYGEDDSGQDLIEDRKFPMTIMLDSKNKITSCSEMLCAESYIVPLSTDFLDSKTCQNFVDNKIKNWKKRKKNRGKDLEQSIKDWRKNNPSPNLNTAPLHFYIPQTLAGESVREVTFNSAPKCMCLGLFSCYQGAWSQSVKCFEFDNP